MSGVEMEGRRDTRDDNEPPPDAPLLQRHEAARVAAEADEPRSDDERADRREDRAELESEQSLQDAAVAAAVAAANAGGPASQTISLIRMIRRGNCISVIYSVPVVAALVTALWVDWDRTCKTSRTCSCPPLKAWCLTQAIIQALMLVVNGAMTGKVIEADDVMENEENSRLFRYLSRISQLLDFSWFVWFIVGCFWIFPAMNRDECTEGLPYVFNTAFALLVVQFVVAGLDALGCCCSCVLVLLRASLLRHYALTAQQDGASQELIDSLPTVQYTTGLVDKVDATCAICLSDYQEGEHLRFLPCKHHFHQKCIDRWLPTNKACPFCKRPVDTPMDVESGGPEAPAAAAPPSESAPLSSISVVSQSEQSRDQASMARAPGMAIPASSEVRTVGSGVGSGVSRSPIQ